MTKPIDLLAELDTKYADYRAAFEVMREALSVAISDYDQWGETWQDSDCQCDRAGDCSHGAIGKARAALALADRVGGGR